VIYKGHVGYAQSWNLDETDEMKKIKKKAKNARKKELRVDRKKELTKRYGEDIATKILAGLKWRGMTKSMLEESWGSPFGIKKSVGSWGVHEQWIYKKSGKRYYLSFENGKLTSWQENELQ
jgi:hypothetical protein